MIDVRTAESALNRPADRSRFSLPSPRSASQPRCELHRTGELAACAARVSLRDRTCREIVRGSAERDCGGTVDG